MSVAWETSNEDVITALNVNGIDSTNFFDEDEWDEFVDNCMSDLDHGAIEDSTLRGDTMEEQTDYALEEIQSQLAASGRI